MLACFLATFTAYVERVGFSIAFTAMAKQAGVSEAVKGTVLSAFFWGYAVSQARHAPSHSASPWGSLGCFQAVFVALQVAHSVAGSMVVRQAAWCESRSPGVAAQMLTMHGAYLMTSGHSTHRGNIGTRAVELCLLSTEQCV